MDSTYREKYHTRKKRQNQLCLSAVAMAIIICSGAVHQCQIPQPAVHVKQSKIETNCGLCHDRKMAMSRFFEKHGSKSPDEMAEAVLKTRSPKLLAKIAITETNGNPHLRKYGYKKKHDGAFGVNRKDWGKVSNNPAEQALQAEIALETFVNEKKSIRTALNGYGGDKTSQTYADRILKDLQRVP